MALQCVDSGMRTTIRRDVLHDDTKPGRIVFATAVPTTCSPQGVVGHLPNETLQKLNGGDTVNGG